MESLSVSTQTLEQFLEAPFYQKDTQQKHLMYESRYQAYRKANRIRIKSVVEVDHNYFILFSVPSETAKEKFDYDVVIQFTPPDKDHEMSPSLRHYWVQFFSNSPGFVYKYASLYKLQGYLIETLQMKFAPGTLDTLPDKANSNYTLYFDSSIYYACRFMLDNKLTYFNKIALTFWKRNKFSQFVDNIRDFQSSQAARNGGGTVELDSKIKTEINKDRKLSNVERHKLASRSKVYSDQIKKKDKLEKKVAKMSTDKDAPPSIVRPVKSTSKVHTTTKVNPTKKKTASKSTRRK